MKHRRRHAADYTEYARATGLRYHPAELCDTDNDGTPLCICSYPLLPTQDEREAMAQLTTTDNEGKHAMKTTKSVSTAIPPCGCKGGPCYWKPEIIKVPGFVGMELYHSHKGPRLRFEGYDDYASSIEVALIKALTRQLTTTDERDERPCKLNTR
jgi:hypothetical protein